MSQMSSPTKSSNVLKLVVFVGIGCFLLALILGVALGKKPLVRYLTLQQAKAHGIELQMDDLEVGWGWARLTGVKFGLEGVPSMQGQAVYLHVTARGIEPQRIDVGGLKLEVAGSPADVALQLGHWTRRYPKAYALPVVTRGAQVRWRPTPGAEPWANLSEVDIEAQPPGRKLTAKQAKLAGLEFGTFEAAWSPGATSVTLGLGKGKPEDAPIRAVVDHAKSPATAQLTLEPVAVGYLARPFGTPPVDLANVQVGAVAFATLNDDGSVDGSLKVRLPGYIPPHPPELAGFVFGEETRFDTKFQVSANHERATFTESEAQSGAFKLKGGGSAERHPTHARVRLKMVGHLPCNELAKASAETRLGKTWGPLLGGLARGALSGSVGVTVEVDADTRKLSHAKLVKKIGIGCGLKLPGSNLKLDLPKLDQIPALPNLPLPVVVE